MELKFYGADKEVTGSCHCVQTGGYNILIDCGLEQGAEEKEDNALPFDAKTIDFVLVTHAHVDHSGRLPLLVKNGFDGQIITTSKTADLLKIMLLDSAHIQESDAKWKTTKNKRAAKPAFEPLYTQDDAQKTLQYLRVCEYEETVAIAEGVQARFTDAGHLLGSASITLDVEENGVMRRLVFSGDIGNHDQPIIRDPQYLHDADYVIIESTYGNRLHKKADDLVAELASIFDRTFSRGGSVVIPSFAVGRTQELLYYIREIKDRHLVKSCPDFPVYVDSPLAFAATKIYDGDLHGYADEETIEILQSGFNPISFHNLGLCQTLDESIALNRDQDLKVIISASGMCDAGRIRHHLKHNLWRPECSVIFVGYQAVGTLGRILLERPPQVKLFGEEIAVRAEIYNFRNMSSHADRDGLLKWMSEFENKPKRVFVVHGEENAALSLSRELQLRGFRTTVPDYQMSYDLIDDVILHEGIHPSRLRRNGTKKAVASSCYANLLLAGEQILEAIRHNEGGTNKDLTKFAEQIKALAQKWDR